MLDVESKQIANFIRRGFDLLIIVYQNNFDPLIITISTLYIFWKVLFYLNQMIFLEINYFLYRSPITESFNKILYLSNITIIYVHFLQGRVSNRISL
jgi:hypothetical protein